MLPNSLLQRLFPKMVRDVLIRKTTSEMLREDHRSDERPWQTIGVAIDDAVRCVRCRAGGHEEVVVC